MRSSRKLGLVLLIVMIVLPAISFAGGITMEYKVYGGFDAIHLAFKKIGLIYNSSLYNSALFLGIVGVGVGAILISTAISGIGGKANYGQAFAMFITGIALFSSLFIKTGGGSNLQIFDPVRNTTVNVGGLPDGIVLLAGTLNKIEMVVIQFIVDNGDTGTYGTYGSNLAYTNNPGGLGFSLLEAATGNINYGPNEFTLTLNQYVKDCFLPVLAIPGTGVTLGEITNTTGNFYTQLNKGASVLLTTTVYDAASGGAGSQVTCNAAWTSAGTWDGVSGIGPFINARLNEGVALTNTVLKQICGSGGFDTTSLNSLQSCSDVMTALYTQIAGGNPGFLTVAGSGSALGWQAIMAKSISGIAGYQGQNSGALAGYIQNRNMMPSGIGAMANEWLPVGKSVMTAVAICLMPILTLFLLTPAWPKALGTIIGFFVWIAAWGMTDALTHSIALDYSLSYITSNMGDGGVGMQDLMSLPTTSAKAMTMFGLVRGSGAALATMLAGLVTAFGGHALGGIAGGAISGEPIGYGKEGIKDASTHDRLSNWHGLSGSAKGFAMPNGLGYGNIAAGAAWSESNKISAGAWAHDNRGGIDGGFKSGVTDAQKSWDGQESFKGGMDGAGGFGGLLKQDNRQGFQDKSMTGQKVIFNDKVHEEIKNDMINQSLKEGAFQKAEEALAGGKDNTTKDLAEKNSKEAYKESYQKAINQGKSQQEAERSAETAAKDKYMGTVEQSGLYKAEREHLKQDYELNKGGIKDKINSQAEAAAWQFQAIGGSSMKPGEAFSNYEGLKKAAEKSGSDFNPFDATKKILDQHAGQAGGKELARQNAMAVTGVDIPTAEWNMLQSSGGSISWNDNHGRTHSITQKAMLGKPGEVEMDMTTRGVGGTETRRQLRQDENGAIVQTAVATTTNGSAIKLGSMQQTDGTTAITDIGKELVTGSITEGRSALATAIATQSLSKTTGDTEQWSHALKAGLSSSKSSEFSNNMNWATSDGLKTMESRNTEMSDSTKKAAATAMTLAGKAGISLGFGPDGLKPSGAIGGNLSADEKKSFEHAVNVINKDSASSGHDWGKTVSDTYGEASKKAWSKTFTADDTKQIAHQIGVTDVDQINNARQIANKVDMNITGTEAQVNYLNGLNNEKTGSDHKFSSKPASPERVEEVAAWVAKNPGQHKSEFQDFLQSTSGLGSVASLDRILNDTKSAVDFQSKSAGKTQGLQDTGESVHKAAETAVAPTMKEVDRAKTAGGVKPVDKDHFLKNNPGDMASAKMVIAQNNSANAAKELKDSPTWSEPIVFKLTDSNPGNNQNSTFFSSVSKAQVPTKNSGGKTSYSTLGGEQKTQYNVTNPGGWSSPEIENKGERK